MAFGHDIFCVFKKVIPTVRWNDLMDRYDLEGFGLIFLLHLSLMVLDKSLLDI